MGLPLLFVNLAEGLDLGWLHDHEATAGRTPLLPQTLPKDDQLDSLKVQRGVQINANVDFLGILEREKCLHVQIKAAKGQ